MATTMEGPLVGSPMHGSFTSDSVNSMSEPAVLWSHNPFEEEDLEEQSNYTLVTSLFSRMKEISSAVAASAVGVATSAASGGNAAGPQPRRPSATHQSSVSSFASRVSASERPNSLTLVPSSAAAPLVSRATGIGEMPSLPQEVGHSPSRHEEYTSPLYDPHDGGHFSTSIPGFPIPEDARSIRTVASTTINRSASVTRVIRRIRGEGLSRDYWMDDENCKECYDCKSVFTTWRRKHHCRICGQIFCSQCASNIIKGERFGHEGMVRVCNLCLEKLASVDGDADGDDDKQSVISSTHSVFPAHQLGHLPQSPYAASHMFDRQPFPMYTIPETFKKLQPFGSEDSGFPSRPVTPFNMDDEDRRPVLDLDVEPPRDMVAPFRRGLSDDERNGNTDIFDPQPETPTIRDMHTPEGVFNFPTSADGPGNSIAFPTSSPDQHTFDVYDSPARPRSRMRSRFNSYGNSLDFDTPSFPRSRVQSRLDSVMTGEAGWRTRRESTAYAQELNLSSMFHLRMMLRQMLTKEGIPNIREWEETLLKLALKIARELTFTALPHRAGEDMDVRRYVKIKKIPGGTPQDSEYVDGPVITKNAAHKQMSRSQRNPRVMLVTFPLEFSRVEGQYLLFSQILRQEKEYLVNLASRIAALRPHIVLVEGSVSRTVLETLGSQNIVVARTVKPSAIQCIARMTQGDIFSSMDKLALEPKLGHCTKFKIQTYDHPLIPGRRKTYMRFEGCTPAGGATLILRGADLATLKRIKKVTRFLTFIVRNLKLETHLWKDSVITLPPLNNEAIPTSPSNRNGLGSGPLPPSPTKAAFAGSSPPKETSHKATPSADVEDDLPDEDAEQLRLSRRIQESLDPYTNTFISVSATLRFPPPQPIRRMKELDDELVDAKQAWEDEVIRLEEQTVAARGLPSLLAHPWEASLSSDNTPKIHGHAQEATITGPPRPILEEESELEINHDDLSALIDALPSPSVGTSSSLPKTPTTRGPLFPEDEPREYFNHHSGASSASSVITLSTPALSPPVEEPSTPLKAVADIALQSRLSLVKWQHEEQRRIWDWYMRKNKDDFVVEKYQCISLWEYVVPTTESGLHQPCLPPQLHYLTFYGENDCTLGQYIEKSVTDTIAHIIDPKIVCEGKKCQEPLPHHSKVYVHNESKVFVAVEQWDGQIVGRSSYSPAPEIIITWSACRTCGSATPFIPVSEEMQRYSFAKFLELHFYPADVKLVQGAGCSHNIYRDHVRYFASKGMTVRFQADSIAMHEIVYPPIRIRVRPETQLELKNVDFDRLHYRNEMWYTALIEDLKMIKDDAATGDEDADGKLNADVDVLMARAEAERRDITRTINKIYRESAPTDTLALNQVRSMRQDNIVAWQQDFDRLPKPRTATVSRGSRTSAFGSVRAMWPKRYDLYSAFDGGHMPSSSVSEAEEGPLTHRRVTGDSFASSASEASESDTNEPTRVTEVRTASPEPTSSIQEEESSVPEDSSAEPNVKSDPDSDSTIGAAREDVISPEPGEASSDAGPMGEPGAMARDKSRTSRLPRRSAHNNVSELVKRYSAYIPAQGINELSKTAFPPSLPPLVSESEQEYPGPMVVRNPRSRNRHIIAKKVSTSDFEQGYAANVAPRYLAHTRRPLGQAHTRIPAPIGPPPDSRESSRRPSPEKRSSGGRSSMDSISGRLSPPPMSRGGTGSISGSRIGRGKPPTRGGGKDRSVSTRIASNASKTGTVRRPPPASGKVSTLAKQYEQRFGARDGNQQKSHGFRVIRGRRARPVASARAKVEVLDSIKDAVQDDSESSDSSEADDEDEGDVVVKSEEPSPESSGMLPPVPASPVVHDHPLATPPEEDSPSIPKVIEPVPVVAGDAHSTPDDRSIFYMPPSPFLSGRVPSSSMSIPPDMELNPGGGERSSIMKAISGLWLQPSQNTQRIRVDHYEGEDFMSDPEHIFRDSSMVVRTDEPTSIIALALNSPTYRDMLTKSRAEKRTAREARLTDNGESFMPDDHSVAESSTWGVVNVDTAEVDPMEELRVPSSKLPWAISFESGELTISCTVLYPEQFDALRRTYDCEKSMIESLARCIKWDASGGKSGSAFLKTRDDRFIAKELSRPELQTMETFAPAYFDYMSSAVSDNRPTLLAKVFGCYKISWKKTGKDKGSGKNKSTQMNLLVMENLFYDRQFSKIYDLKGSTRNRHVQSTGRKNEVLLDENLLETSHLHPFYLREHSKRILRAALINDSRFLADISVMDYSLVVGVDSDRNELVVGIVDYIRTYTWDKKLESWVKESAFLGGAGKGEPTIVTPKQYRQRFIAAMERYFPLVPDRWMKQKDSPEEDP